MAKVKGRPNSERQRRSSHQPRVAPTALPWVGTTEKTINPEGVVVVGDATDTQPFQGCGDSGTATQGRRCAPTLGCMTERRWRSSNTRQTVASVFSLAAVILLLVGCSKQPTQQTPLLTLASNERGNPQFDYTGPGKLSYRHSFDSFSYQIGATTSIPWVTGRGEMRFSDSNHMIVSIQSSSDRPYEIELLGIWTNRSSDIPENMAKERLRIPAGEQNLNIERFVIWTYDFAKEKRF